MQYKYIVRIANANSNDTFAVNAESSREAAHKVYKLHKQAGFLGNWIDFRKLVISSKRVRENEKM